MGAGHLTSGQRGRGQGGHSPFGLLHLEQSSITVDVFSIIKSEAEKSYGVALKYLKKTYPNNLFKTWSELCEDDRTIWCEFTNTRLYCNMNNLLYNELICTTAEKGKHMFIVK